MSVFYEKLDFWCGQRVGKGINKRMARRKKEFFKNIVPVSFPGWVCKSSVPWYLSKLRSISKDFFGHFLNFPALIKKQCFFVFYSTYKQRFLFFSYFYFTYKQRLFFFPFLTFPPPINKDFFLVSLLLHPPSNSLFIFYLSFFFSNISWKFTLHRNKFYFDSSQC